MKKIYVIAIILFVGFAFSACKTVWFSEIKKLPDNSYLVTGNSNNAQGEVYKCVRLGEKFKCKLITSGPAEK